MNYGGIPDTYAHPDHSRIVILPVPYDATSTYVKGADKGPDAILDASANMELYDIETGLQVYEYGIFTDHPVDELHSPDEMVMAVYNRVARYIRKKQFAVTIGGNHSVSIGAAKAHHEAFPGMTVLQLDAHTDLRQSYEGSIFNHACAMARIREFSPIVQVGIRSMCDEELPYLDRDRVFFAHDMQGQAAWQQQVVDKLSRDVYVTIDLDVFDPSVMPSTGTPEPGGLYYHEVLGLLRKCNEERNIVGFDVVELCPIENFKAPDFLASKLIYQLLSYKFAKK